MDEDYIRKELTDGLETLPEQISPNFAGWLERRFARKYITGLQEQAAAG